MHTGAGKTTLLDVLSGRRQGSSVAGVICLNGHRATPAQVPRPGVQGAAAMLGPLSCRQGARAWQTRAARRSAVYLMCLEPHKYPGWT